jgi:streptomycin 6-kinase
VLDRWGLRVGEPYPYAQESVVFPTTTPEGEPAVLKIAYPGRENAHEADALERWAGDGAAILLDRDDEHRALLMERCEPGTPLSARNPTETLGVLIDLLIRLWRPAGPPFRRLEEEAAWWAGYLEADYDRAGRPFDRRLLDAALDALRELPSTQGTQVLVHQDLHGDNVLRARRQPWLAIDPKPLLAEREFSVAPIVRSFELGSTEPDVLHRLDRLTAELGLDRERARRWTIVQTIAWAFEGERAFPWHVAVAGWLFAAADRRPR